MLKEAGFEYWGLMLEFAPVKLHEWQAAGATDKFQALQDQTATAQVYAVLVQSIAESVQRGIHTAIWSNEWFFGRHHSVIPALKKLEAQGIRVDIVAYVRRHDAWAKSAYIQWGLKHKTYSGPLMTFKQYIKRRPVRFAGTLSHWAEAFSGNLNLRNFDTAGDAVDDFTSALSLPVSLKSVRVNEAPTSEELFLRSFYNSKNSEEALPVDFNRRFSTQAIDFNLNPTAWLLQHLPESSDLQKVIADSVTDFDSINAMLISAGQMPLETSVKQSKPANIDFEKLTAILLQMLFLQGNKLQNLQKQVNQITKHLSEDTK